MPSYALFLLIFFSTFFAFGSAQINSLPLSSSFSIINPTPIPLSQMDDLQWSIIVANTVTPIMDKIIDM